MQALTIFVFLTVPVNKYNRILSRILIRILIGILKGHVVSEKKKAPARKPGHSDSCLYATNTAHNSRDVLFLKKQKARKPGHSDSCFVHAELN